MLLIYRCSGDCEEQRGGRACWSLSGGVARRLDSFSGVLVTGRPVLKLAATSDLQQRLSRKCDLLIRSLAAT